MKYIKYTVVDRSFPPGQDSSKKQTQVKDLPPVKNTEFRVQYPAMARLFSMSHPLFKMPTVFIILRVLSCQVHMSERHIHQIFVSELKILILMR